MRCLTSDETIAALRPLAASVSDDNQWYRRELIFDASLTRDQGRIAFGLPGSARSLLGFIDRVVAWIGRPGVCLLWISRVEEMNRNANSAVVDVIRLSSSDGRPVAETPGHLFADGPYTELDASELSDGHRREAALLGSLICHLILSGSDGWLLAPGSCDRVELWEGNVLFYSSSNERLAEAQAIHRDFDCSAMD